MITWSSSVVYIFHKGIISLVLIGYKGQMNMFILVKVCPFMITTVLKVPILFQNTEIYDTKIMTYIIYTHTHFLACDLFSDLDIQKTLT